jgi:hypothetical protein
VSERGKNHEFSLYSFFQLRLKGNLTGTKPVSRLAIVGAKKKQVAEEENENNTKKRWN